MQALIFELIINKKMKYYQCKFRASGAAYSIDKYDLKTDKESEIKKVLKGEGYKVLEIYDIKEQ